jgi:hypothetical protein
MINLKRKKRTRPIFFVCAGLNDTNELKTKAIQAASVEEAVNLFNTQFGFKPKDVLGPFHKKQTKVLANTIAIKMSARWENAEYNGWNVKANILKEPPNQAFLLFNSRIDGQIAQKPQGTIIVPIQDLRLLNVK